MSEIEQKLAAIYARIPDVNCQGKCSDYCGPIMMSEPERLRILARIGHPPFSMIFPSVGQGYGGLLFRERLSIQGGGAGCLDCPMLTAEKRCKVYDLRPLICRLWGAAEDLRCPFGCRPEQYLTRGESTALIRESMAL